MEIHCVGHNTSLNLSLSCSPVGMTLETAENTTVFTQSGLFAGHIKVTVHDYNDTVLAFGLRVWDPVSDVSEDELILNDTLIPLHFCNLDPKLKTPTSEYMMCHFTRVSPYSYVKISARVCRCSNWSSCGCYLDVIDFYHLHYSRLPC